MSDKDNNKDFAFILCIVFLAVVVYFIFYFLFKDYFSFLLFNGFMEC